MINYYKSGVNFYRIDIDSKSFYHINGAEDMSYISLITNEGIFDKLSKAITDNVGGEWVVILEEEFNIAKEKVLIKITSL